MSTTTTWEAVDLSHAQAIGPIEFSDSDGESHYFDLMMNDDKIIFGGGCNTGFLQSGYIRRHWEDMDQTLRVLLHDLETYYNDGPEHVRWIVCNERM